MSKLERMFDMEEKAILRDMSKDQCSIVPVSNIHELEKTTDESDDYSALESDFKKTRELLQATAKTASEMLDSAAELAMSSQEPKAYDAATNLVAALNNLAINMTKVHTDKANAQKTAPVTQTVNATNAVFVGSTKDLQKMLREARTGETEKT